MPYATLEKQREYYHDYYIKNKAKRQRYDKTLRANNRDKDITRKQKWHNDNKERANMMYQYCKLQAAIGYLENKDAARTCKREAQDAGGSGLSGGYKSISASPINDN